MSGGNAVPTPTDVDAQEPKLEQPKIDRSRLGALPTAEPVTPWPKSYYATKPRSIVLAVRCDTHDAEVGSPCEPTGLAAVHLATATCHMGAPSGGEVRRGGDHQ